MKSGWYWTFFIDYFDYLDFSSSLFVGAFLTLSTTAHFEKVAVLHWKPSLKVAFFPT